MLYIPHTCGSVYVCDTILHIYHCDHLISLSLSLSLTHTHTHTHTHTYIYIYVLYHLYFKFLYIVIGWRESDYVNVRV